MPPASNFPISPAEASPILAALPVPPEETASSSVTMTSDDAVFTAFFAHPAIPRTMPSAKKDTLQANTYFLLRTFIEKTPYVMQGHKLFISASTDPPQVLAHTLLVVKREQVSIISYGIQGDHAGLDARETPDVNRSNPDPS